MAASSGHSSSKSRALRRAGGLILLAAVSFWWHARRDVPQPAAGRDAGSASAVSGSSPASPRPPASASLNRAPAKDVPRPTLRELADRHETRPDAEEWELLLRLLQQDLPEEPTEEDREISEAVKARFVAHAGAEQMDKLASIYHNSSSMEIGQRALEVLGTLQSDDFQQHARTIIADATLPTDDQVVTALARSLAHNGTPQDITLILDRIDTGKAQGHSEYNGMDGLMSAIHGALDPEMEPVLLAALANDTGTRTWPSRLAAAAALRNHSTSASTQVLSQAARQDPDPRVAKEAAESLAELRATEE